MCKCTHVTTGVFNRGRDSRVGRSLRSGRVWGAQWWLEIARPGRLYFCVADLVVSIHTTGAQLNIKRLDVASLLDEMVLDAGTALKIVADTLAFLEVQYVRDNLLRSRVTNENFT